MEGPFHGQRSIDNSVQDIEISSPNNQMPSIFARKFSPEKIWKLNVGENSSISSSNYIDDPRDSLRQFICQPISGMMTISIIYKIPLFKLLHQYLFSFSWTILLFCSSLCPFRQPYLCLHFHIGLQTFFDLSLFLWDNKWKINLIDNDHGTLLNWLFVSLFVFFDRQTKCLLLRMIIEWCWSVCLYCLFISLCLIVKRNASYWEWS